MSIVFINNTLETFTPTQSGAVATVLWQLCQAARLQGFVPTVLTGNGSAKSYDWPQMLFVDYPRVPASRIGIGLYRLERRLNGWRHLRQRAYGLRVVSVIRKAGMAERPLVLHNDPELAVLLRRFFPNAFLAHHFHNQLECKPKFRAQFRDAVDAVSAVSGFTARWIEGYYGLSAGSAAIIYNGVDSRRFAPAAEPPAGLPVINFVGRTGIEKAPDLLLRAAQRLSEKTKSFRLQIIGSNHWDRLEMDDYQRQLSGLADVLERHGVEVRRPGHIGREALPAEFRKAHIHVVPSRWDEPYALTLTEGMASGLATVASNTGGMPEVIGEAGFLFERDDAEELAQRLYCLITDEPLRREYGRKARARAEEFTWDRAWLRVKELAGI